MTPFAGGPTFASRPAKKASPTGNAGRGPYGTLFLVGFYDDRATTH
jgi:hypothetical protein